MIYGVSFNCTATIAIDGFLTLNGLSDGYGPNILSGIASAPIVVSAVAGSSASPPTVTLIQAYGGYEEIYDEGSEDIGYTLTVTYNLPDSTLLQIYVDIEGVDSGTSFNLKQAVASVKINGTSSLYAVVNNQTGGAADSGYTLSFSLVLASSVS